MIVDGRHISAGEQLAADICVVGAGAAGITLAMALADLNANVIILESGGLDPGGPAQDLARGQSIGQHYVPLESARLRCLGGSTMHWGGWCRPLDPIDFERRPWVPYSGWPITRADLDPYYVQAQEICQLGNFDYDPADWLLPSGSVLPLWGDRVRTRLIQFSPPTRFGVRYRDVLARARTTTVVLNSTVVSLRATESGRTILAAHAATLAGNSFDVSAKYYVIAAGGIDNPRLLLASNKAVNCGIGNGNDLVGRFFADHVQLDTAGLMPTSRGSNLDLYQLSSRDVIRRFRHAGGRGARLMGYLTLSPQVQASRGTLNYSANVFETTWSDYFQMQNVVTGTSSSTSWNIGHTLENLWTDLDDVVETAFSSSGKAARFYKIVTTQEQAPNPSSRITLSTERDELGMPRPVLDWRLSDLDRHTIEIAVDELSRAFGGGNCGTVHFALDLARKGWPEDIPISWHHCGTTRMSSDPKQGVVDEDGLVHGVSNLYVAGSSLFPTLGNGNPTLTIVALTLRQAHHLREMLK